MKTILVPLDGSALAEQILPYVAALAPLLEARVRLLQVAHEPEAEVLVGAGITSLYGAREPFEREHERARFVLEETLASAESYLAARAAKLQDLGIEVSCVAQAGPAAEVIVELAHSPDVALIAMATHGYSGLRRWALGSVADRVVQAASAPVFLIRATQYTPAKPFALERVLVPLDGSGLAEQALPIAQQLATNADAELVLVQAVSPRVEAYPSLLTQPAPPYGELLSKLHEYASAQLNIMAERLRAAGTRVTTIVENGHAAEVIVEDATRRHASVIVMATHGRGGLRRWALGSVADKVLHAAAIPLVLVRAR